MRLEIHIDDRLLRPFARVLRSRGRVTALAVLLLSGGAAVWAAPGDDIAPTFTAGAPLTADGLNGAFGQVTAQIATLKGTVDTLAADVDTAEAAIDAVAADVAKGEVGDIMASFLPTNAFYAVRGTGWVLCDGRDVTGSTFHTLTGLTHAPDLRGVFLRGKNHGRTDGFGDAAGERSLGSLQGDSFASHAHTINHDHPAVTSSIESNDHTHTTHLSIDGVGGGGPAGALQHHTNGIWAVTTTSGGASASHTHDVNIPAFAGTSGSSGGPETAPRNVAVNYYCKVND